MTCLQKTVCGWFVSVNALGFVSPLSLDGLAACAMVFVFLEGLFESCLV